MHSQSKTGFRRFAAAGLPSSGRRPSNVGIEAGESVMPDLSRLDVCFIAGTLGQGGAERQLYYIVSALLNSGARVRLLCLSQGEFWEDKIRELGVKVTWVGQQQSRVARLARIVSELRNERPDIVQSQHFYTNLYAVGAARLLGIREVGAIRSNGVREVHANGSVLGRLSLHAPRVIAANSRAAIQNATALGVPDDRLHFLPNVVDTDYFRPTDRRGEEPIRLVAAGRLEKLKRFDRFIAIVDRLRRQLGARIRATIVGDGPLRPDLESQARELGLLPDVIEFRGSVADMATVYREADILVLASDWEGTPNVILEAMASGLPVVATRVGGVPDLVQHGETGFLAIAGDEGCMSGLLARLINDPYLRMEMGWRAREFAESDLSARRLPGLLSNVYEVALS